MRARELLTPFLKNRAAALAVGVALALVVTSLLAVTARADENHGNSAHSVSLSCPGAVNEGNSVVVTLTRGDNATKPIKGELRTQDYFAEWADFENLDVDINHNGDTKEVEIDTADDSTIEGDESFRVRWKNDHNNSNQSCLILIRDDDDVDVQSLTVTSTPETGNVYGLGELIKFTMVLDTEVDAASWANIPFQVSSRIAIITDLKARYRNAKYESGSGTDTIVYRYKVQRYDLDNNGLTIHARGAMLGLAGLKYAGTDTAVSIAGYSAQWNLSGHKLDGLPRITGFEITSAPEDGDAYRLFEDIVVEMTLDAKVQVHGTPGLKLTMGDETAWATYDADLTEDANDADDGKSVIFVYEVGPQDEASDGVEVPENDTDARTQFVIPGRTADVDDDGNAIDDRLEVFHEFNRFASIQLQSHYDHDGLVADSDHAVDGTDPLIEISIGAVNNALGATLTFWNIPNDEGDLTWRADITSDGDDKDDCEGTNMGADNTIDEDDIPELGESIERTVNLTSSCGAGTYSLEVTATVDGEEVAEASKSFQINLSWMPAD